MHQIYLIRHAESTANAGTNVPVIGEDNKVLTESGHNQAITLSQQFKNSDVKPTAIYSSPLMRAIQTAEHLAETFKLSIEITTSLSELDYLRPLDTSTTTKEERQAQKAMFWDKTASDFEYVDGEIDSGAESFADFLHRCQQSLDLLKILPDGSLVVSHSLMITGLLKLIDNKSPKQIFADFRQNEINKEPYFLKNTQVISLALDKSGLKVASMNLFNI